MRDGLLMTLVVLVVEEREGLEVLVDGCGSDDGVVRLTGRNGLRCGVCIALRESVVKCNHGVSLTMKRAWAGRSVMRGDE